jgi:hypothetical protein
VWLLKLIIMKKIYSILLIVGSLFVFTGCETEDTIPESELGTTHFAFGTQTFDFGVSIDASDTRDIEVYSAFTSTSDRTLEIMVMTEGTTLEAVAYSVPASVTIPANSNMGLLSVEISDTNLDPEGDVMIIGFPAKEGEYVADSIVINISRLCPTGTKGMKLSIVNTDGYPDEASFDFINSDGDVILTLAAKELVGDIEFKECLPAGEYTLNVADSYGDGGTSYVVSYDGVEVASISGDSYTTDATETFSF